MDIDPTIYLAAVPAVILVGLTKGGMGEALALLGVPILAMAIPPAQAAAILLPILIVMDMVSLWIWRSSNNRRLIEIMLPGALIGIFVGWATSAYVPRDALRFIIGVITILFAVRYFYTRWQARFGILVAPKPHRLVPAVLLSTLSGYGSFVAHAGGAPFQIYGLPLKLPPRDYTGAAVRFFAILNAVKLIPYFALGQLDTANLYISATLVPLAAIATMIGGFLIKRMKPEVFYPFMYTMALLAGIKLAADGLMALV
ncbi:sulfite exporter TauE/SafE family protein [Sinorhizobium sp. BG8]|uniref:sulfite exporter TauE/SafE family protein n=1 Tax=Sinorhizobium sp. BG8 TaxID=2613773 RepID=UPI00193D73DC|nr:sulfite exporter TauE/SafE family protein [Sinorhizobium sp. BG8]QRM56627.1 sulfite exporter TauE/SafE family protein [Sinorhizobium sp. BG8]